MTEKIISDMEGIAVKAMTILDELRAYQMCEEEDFKALMKIRDKATGAKSLALHVYLESKVRCEKTESGL